MYKKKDLTSSLRYPVTTDGEVLETLILQQVAVSK